MYGFAITSPGVPEIGEQLNMFETLGAAKDAATFEVCQYTVDVFLELAEFIREDVKADVLEEYRRVAIEIIREDEHVLTLRFEKVW